MRYRASIGPAAAATVRAFFDFVSPRWRWLRKTGRRIAQRDGRPGNEAVRQRISSLDSTITHSLGESHGRMLASAADVTDRIQRRDVVRVVRPDLSVDAAEAVWSAVRWA